MVIIQVVIEKKHMMTELVNVLLFELDMNALVNAKIFGMTFTTKKFVIFIEIAYFKD